MVKESTFRGIISFLNDIGIYDVVLPFLLVFTIVFAILEKTTILGTDEVGGKKFSKKNLNGLVAFVIAFLFVASARLVSLINEAMANIVILLMLSIGFLLLIGSFYREGEGVFLEKGSGWRTAFMFIMFIGISLIFLNAIKLKDGSTWLEAFWKFISNNWQSRWVGSVIFVIFAILILYFIVKEPSQVKKARTEHAEQNK